MSWSIEIDDGVLTVEGEVGEKEVAVFCRRLEDHLVGVSTVDMLDLEILDGLAMAMVVGSVRRCLPLRIRYAPQMLAHTLYKIGLLGSEGLELLEPRYDRN
jgi:hypothetical protein